MSSSGRLRRWNNRWGTPEDQVALIAGKLSYSSVHKVVTLQ